MTVSRQFTDDLDRRFTDMEAKIEKISNKNLQHKTPANEEVAKIKTALVLASENIETLATKLDTLTKRVDAIAENFKMPYYTLTPTFSICPFHGYITGEHSFCPKCDDESEYHEGEEFELKAT